MATFIVCSSWNSCKWQQQRHRCSETRRKKALECCCCCRILLILILGNDAHCSVQWEARFVPIWQTTYVMAAEGLEQRTSQGRKCQSRIATRIGVRRNGRTRMRDEANVISVESAARKDDLLHFLQPLLSDLPKAELCPDDDRKKIVGQILGGFFGGLRKGLHFLLLVSSSRRM